MTACPARFDFDSPSSYFYQILPNFKNAFYNFLCCCLDLAFILFMSSCLFLRLAVTLGKGARYFSKQGSKAAGYRLHIGNYVIAIIYSYNYTKLFAKRSFNPPPSPQNMFQFPLMGVRCHDKQVTASTVTYLHSNLF
jgi:hypothetical protein